MCNSVTIEIDNKELQYRRLIMSSIEHALKRGDEVFDRLVSNDVKTPRTVPFDKFKESLKNIDHENLKK